jgi:hypothetical protein
MEPTTFITNIYELLIMCILLCWFVATVICQFKETRLSKFIRNKIDILSFVPLWTFFAPNPGKRDYHLIYRDKYDEGVVSEWKEIEITEERYWWSFLWNPQKRDKKVLSDIIQNLITLVPEYKRVGADNNLIACSLPYIIVLGAVSRQDTDEKKIRCTARQFMLAESTGYQEEPTVGFILLSLFHTTK